MSGPVDFIMQMSLRDCVTFRPVAQAPNEKALMTNSGSFDGTSTDGSVQAVTKWLEEQHLGRAAKNCRIASMFSGV